MTNRETSLEKKSFPLSTSKNVKHRENLSRKLTLIPNDKELMV